MSHKHAPSKKAKKKAPILSVEGSRELEPQVTPHVSSRRFSPPHLSAKTLMLISLVVVVLLLIASMPAYYFYNQYKASQQLKTPEEQVKSLTAEVGSIILLPTGETPTIATVSDKSKLAGQQFFTNAQNGDKVLIYTNAKRAILYRPSEKKIIEVGPININSDAGKANGSVAGASTSATITPAVVRVGLLNGTTVVGLTRKVEPTLVSKVPGVQVVLKDNAAKNDYAQTLVIANTSSSSSVADQIAKLLGGKVSALPAGEVAPANTDITVILGKNSAGQ